MAKKRLPFRARGIPFQQKQSSVSATFATSRSLAILPIDDFPLGTGVSERERNVITLKSIKLQMAIRNDDNHMRVFRWAIVTQKQSNITADIPLNFFKGNDQDMGLDFTTTRTGQQLCNDTINRRVLEVTAQGRFQIGGVIQNVNQLKTAMNIQEIIPINKKMTFDQPSSTVPFRRTCIVFWWDSPYAASAAPTNTQFLLNTVVTRYFHDAI